MPSAPTPPPSGAGAAAIEASPPAAPPERAGGEEPEEGELPEEGEVAGAPAHEAPAKRPRMGGPAASGGAHRRGPLRYAARPWRSCARRKDISCWGMYLKRKCLTALLAMCVETKQLCSCRAAPWGAAEGAGHSLAGQADVHNGQACTDGGQGVLGHAAGYPDMYMHAGGAPNGYPAPGDGWRDHDAHPDALRGAPPPSAHNVF